MAIGEAIAAAVAQVETGAAWKWAPEYDLQSVTARACWVTPAAENPLTLDRESRGAWSQTCNFCVTLIDTNPANVDSNAAQLMAIADAIANAPRMAGASLVGLTVASVCDPDWLKGKGIYIGGLNVSYMLID
ncbi:MAG: hypothetical protein J6P03_03435 [Opitutales bacterium]|nr:hypothetical protein [Opitutales bacterium]